MRKVIISSNILWTITQFRLGLIAFLKENNFEVVCLADTDSFSLLSEQKIKEVNAKFIHVPITRKGLNPYHDVKYLIRLLRIFKSEKPDIVINYTIKPVLYGSLAAFLLRIPSFAVITGLGFVFIRNSILARFIRLSYKVCLGFPHKVFFLNQDDHDLFISYNIVDRMKSIILPGEGINTSFYKPQIRLKQNSFKFLLIARLLWDKGVGEYIEAKNILNDKHGIRNVEFLLLGHIDEDNPSGIDKQLVHFWHENKMINYLGTVEDTRSIISDSDCVVLPSYREGVPRTLLEAAAMEKPIIAANSIGCKDVVDDNVTGFLCVVKDPIDLAEKMKKMYDLSDSERRLMGIRGREKMIRQFDDNIVFEVYFNELTALFCINGKVS